MAYYGILVTGQPIYILHRTVCLTRVGRPNGRNAECIDNHVTLSSDGYLYGIAATYCHFGGVTLCNEYSLMNKIACKAMTLTVLFPRARPIRPKRGDRPDLGPTIRKRTYALRYQSGSSQQRCIGNLSLALHCSGAGKRVTRGTRSA